MSNISALSAERIISSEIISRRSLSDSQETGGFGFLTGGGRRCGSGGGVLFGAFGGGLLSFIAARLCISHALSIARLLIFSSSF